MKTVVPNFNHKEKNPPGDDSLQKSSTLMKMKESFSKLSLPFILLLCLNFSFVDKSFAQPPAPVGFVAQLVSGPVVAGPGQVFLAVGPNQVGANNIVYRLFYSPTATAPANPLTATQYTFGSTPGDGNGTSAFGFMLSGLPGGVPHTFWLYQYNTVTMQYSTTSSSASQTPPAPAPTAPTVAAPAPTCPAGSVISMFSNAYTNVTVDTWRTIWSAAPGVLTDLMIAGNDTKRYEDVTFIGIETVASQINASSMKYLHMDVWSPNFTQFRVKLVDLGADGTFGVGPNPEHEITFTAPAQGTWVSYHIPLTAFTGLTSKSNIAQLILSAMPNGTADFFIDNVYFTNCDVPSPYCNTSAFHLGIPAETPSEIKLSIGNSGENSMTVDIESATASPADVLIVEGAAGATISPFVEVSPGKLRSILRWLSGPPPSNVTINVLWSKTNFGGNWILRDIVVPFIAVCPTIPLLPTAPTTAAPLPTCPSSQVISLFSNSYTNVPVFTFLTPWSAAPVTVTNVQVAGNDVKYYQNVTFLGIETTEPTVNASAMNTFHIDFWSANAAQFRIKLVDFGANGVFGGGDDREHELTFANPKLGEWVSYEIPLSSFTGLTTRSNMAQYVLSGMPNGSVDFYIDNMYFSNCALPSGWSEQAVNCPGTNYSYNPTSQVFTGTSTNCFYPNSFVSDGLASAQRQLCGNGSITALVTSISGSALGWAGVTMRENNAAGAKKAQLMTNLSEFSRREFRTLTGAASYPQQFPSQNRYWLRITRTGTQFVMFVSPNGATWYPVGAQNITMAECIQVGLVITNYTASSTVTAQFSNVTVTGGNPAKPAYNGNISEDIFANTDFTIMPNPTSGYLEINMSAYGKKDVQMEIYNVQGKLMRSATLDAARGIEEVDMTSFVNGMYLIRMKAEGHPDVTKRVVVQH
jgi:Secretion system C-terminal sorting domain